MLFQTIAEARSELLNLTSLYFPYDVHQAFARDERGQYPALSQDVRGRVAYAAKPEYAQDSARRTNTTIQRYITRQLKLELTRELEVACERLLACCVATLDESRFMVRDDVCAAYQYGPSSCMHGADQTEFYDINGVQIVTYYDEPEDWGRNYQGRALLWRTDQGMFLDRIYYDGADEELALRQFKALAVARGWLCRSDSGSLPDLVVRGIEPGAMPYMDSLRYLSRDSRGFYLTAHSRQGALCVQSTEGSVAGLCEDCERVRWLHYSDYSVCCECHEQRERERYYCEFGEHNCEDIRGTVNGLDACSDCWREASDCGNDCEHTRGERFTDLQTVDGLELCPDCAEGAHECQSCHATTLGSHNSTALCSDCDAREGAELAQAVRAMVDALSGAQRA